MSDLSKPSRGGWRPGAGRVAGKGKFGGEATTTVRVPVSGKQAVLRLVEAMAVKPVVLPPGLMRPAAEPPLYRTTLFLSSVNAGFPSPATDYESDALDLNEHLIAHRESTFFLRAKGHSMIGAGIFDGDLLVVDRSITPTHRRIVIAVVDGEFTVKRLFKRGGKIRLLAENPDFAPIEFLDGPELLVWGVVTNVVHQV